MSFDDGREDFFVNAYPLLKQYGLSATLNVVTKYIGEEKAPIMLYLIPAFTIAMCAYYMSFGDYVSNLAVAVLMTVIMWNAAKGLIRVRKQEEGAEKLGLYMMSLLFGIVEYAMWTSSCIWEGNTILYPYYWFDFLLSICFVLFIPAVRKMVDE